jgi:hypothetical protein
MPIIEQVKTSTLSLGGVNPPTAEQATPQSTLQTDRGLKLSALDLDGKSPEKYLDKKPQ